MEGIVACNNANYVPLTPISFLNRAAKLHHDKISMVYGELNFTWKASHQRCIKLASALSSLGLCYGQFVASVIPNMVELYELHFGVPMAGGVLAPLNPRLDATTLSHLLEDLHPKFIFLHQHYIELVIKALMLLHNNMNNYPFLILITTTTTQYEATSTDEELAPKSLHYNDLLNMGSFDFEPLSPKQECDPILVSYTSGSTGKPKGVMYSHRSAYLNTLGEVFRSDLRERIVFLWTADLFRANGWGFIWAIVALGGTNVFMTHDHDAAILDSITLHGVTHLSGHPTVLSTILEEKNKNKNKNTNNLPHKVYAHIAGILPSSNTMLEIKEMGFEVVYRYGMTEVLGPPVKNLWIDNHGPTSSSASTNIMDNIMEEFEVKDPNTMESVACDGKSIGEIMFRGNTIMLGYLKCPKENEKAFKGGWFRTGDLAVRHEDGSIQLKDRAKDVIVNQVGEYISSLEIEAVILGHPKVLQAAVVGIPNANYNGDSSMNYEAPCAFVKLKMGMDANADEIIRFCGAKLPIQMIPRLVIFGDLAVSSTGKVQKFVLREVAKTMHHYTCL